MPKMVFFVEHHNWGSGNFGLIFDDSVQATLISMAIQPLIYGLSVKVVSELSEDSIAGAKELLKQLRHRDGNIEAYEELSDYGCTIDDAGLKIVLKIARRSGIEVIIVVSSRAKLRDMSNYKNRVIYELITENERCDNNNNVHWSMLTEQDLKKIYD